MNRLLDIGFQPSGHWLLEGGKLIHALTRHAAQRNVLYAFVCDGQVAYIGKTTQSLRRRMNGYRQPSATQVTNVRNHARLQEQLSHGVAVEILTLPDNGLLRYGQFHLNLAAGLEDDLIRVIDPPWNGGLVDDGIHPPAPPPARSAETSEEPPEPVIGSFTFVLRQTYFDQGFFNVGVASQGLLGADSESIDICLPSDPQPVSGMINRRANQNGAPRVMGGVGLRQWFREVAAVDSEITVEVLSPTSIRLVTPPE